MPLRSFALNLLKRVSGRCTPPEFPPRPLELEQADAMRMAIQESLRDVQGGEPYIPFASRVQERWPSVEQACDIQDPFLNAVWEFADTFFDECAQEVARGFEPKFIWDTGAGMLNALDLVNQILDHLGRYERLYDEYLMQFYRPPRGRRRRSGDTLSADM